LESSVDVVRSPLADLEIIASSWRRRRFPSNIGSEYLYGAVDFAGALFAQPLESINTPDTNFFVFVTKHANRHFKGGCDVVFITDCGLV